MRGIFGGSKRKSTTTVRNIEEKVPEKGKDKEEPHSKKEEEKTLPGGMKDVTKRYKEDIWELMQATHLPRATHDRTKTHDWLPTGYKIDRVLEFTSPAFEKKYNGYKKRLTEDVQDLDDGTCRKENMPIARTTKDPKTGKKTFVHSLLDRSSCLNEVFLFHGTRDVAAKSIGSDGKGFDMERVGNNVGAMLGPGIYMTDSATKADEYTVEEKDKDIDKMTRRILVNKVLLGRTLVLDPLGKLYKKQLRYLQDHGTSDVKKMLANRGKHSILRDGENKKPHGTFKEYVVFHGEAVWPRFLIEYTRVPDKAPSTS